MSCELTFVLAYRKDVIYVSLRNELRTQDHLSLSGHPPSHRAYPSLCALIGPHDAVHAPSCSFSTSHASPRHTSFLPYPRLRRPSVDPLLLSPHLSSQVPVTAPQIPGSQRQVDRSTLAGRRYKCAPPRYLSGQTSCMSPSRPGPYSDPCVSSDTVTVYRSS
jgi:hypothetical protein